MTGHARRYKECFSSVKEHILDLHDVDVYLSTWNCTQASIMNPQIVPIDVNEILNTYKPKKFHVQDYAQYYNNRFDNIKFLDRQDDIFKTDERAKMHGSNWVERLRDQWYIVKQGWNVIDNPEIYDKIIRLRVDVQLHKIVIDESPNLIVPNKFVPDDITYIVSDHFAIGKPEDMEKYCNLFDNIKSMYLKDNIDISFAEYMLKYYLNNYCNIEPVADPSIDYSLLKW